jgi:hypothetical protein
MLARQLSSQAEWQRNDINAAPDRRYAEFF